MPNIQDIIIAVGYVGIATIVFAESGFLLGFFLPGDSLLVTAGLLASQGYFNIWALVAIVVVAAILGDSFGYATGRILGPRIFNKDESWLFSRKNVERTQEFFDRHGKFTIILARFTPIIRTFAPIMAGVGGMHYRTFVFFNIIGGALWGAGLVLLSYFAGAYIPHFDRYLHYVVIAIIVASVIPLFRHMKK